MTVDAVGGVWRYAMDLASALHQRGTGVVFACLGPAPSAAQRSEAEAIGRFFHLDAPLDWTAQDETDLAAVPGLIAGLAARTGVDLIHLNLPSQAASLRTDLPVVVVSHSCVVTWFRAVRGTGVPSGWEWQQRLNQHGFDAADMVVAPSRSHAGLLTECYREVRNVHVVYNSVRPLPGSPVHLPFIIAAGRWWDEGKNARTLDQAALGSHWPIHMAGNQRGPNGQFQPIESAIVHGELAGSELRQLMASASIFVSPSIYEPFGLAPLEAASSGLPLVLSDIPTYRELWDGAALFANPTNPNDFQGLLNHLSSDEELRADLGAKALTRAKTFTAERQLDAMLTVHADALSTERAYA
jgi:glycosyltransferase involved in cell wall biosynthesis